MCIFLGYHGGTVPIFIRTQLLWQLGQSKVNWLHLSEYVFEWFLECQKGMSVHDSVWWKWFFCQSNYVLQRLRLCRRDTLFRREIDGGVGLRTWVEFPHCEAGSKWGNEWEGGRIWVREAGSEWDSEWEGGREGGVREAESEWDNEWEGGRSKRGRKWVRQWMRGSEGGVREAGSEWGNEWEGGGEKWVRQWMRGSEGGVREAGINEREGGRSTRGRKWVRRWMRGSEGGVREAGSEWDNEWEVVREE